MPAWNELQNEFSALADDQARSQWIEARTGTSLSEVAGRRGARNIIFYGSAFLQKPNAPAESSIITHEDLNGFMSVMHGMDWTKGLTLILHTPGGSPNAAETLVSYLRSKFSTIEVIVPALAMSAGTMVALASELIIMGRQSQLGPIDPQFPINGRYVSARAVVEQFERAQQEVLSNPMNAHVWAPITQSLGPALLQDSQNALDYSEQMVARWLTTWMFAGDADAAQRGQSIAHHFNDASTHKSHGRRIDFDEAASQGVKVERLEDDQALQEAVLTLYHTATLIFEHSPTSKMIIGSTGKRWLKNLPTRPRPGVQQL